MAGGHIRQFWASFRPGGRRLSFLGTGYDTLAAGGALAQQRGRTFKGQLDLERHGGHTPGGVITRILQRILALTAAIWHNDRTGQPVMRSLIAYDYY